MSDTPNPTPSPTSVVLDSNATVKQSRLGVIAAVVVALGLIAFTVVYFATRDSEDDYKPGPVAQAVVESIAASGAEVTFTGGELKCIDQQGKGIDPEKIRNGSLDSFDLNSDEETLTFAGRMYDKCFDRARRVDMFAVGMEADGTATADQAQCAAGALDDAVQDAGGYEVMFTSSEDELFNLVFGLMGAMADCGIDMGSMMGES